MDKPKFLRGEAFVSRMSGVLYYVHDITTFGSGMIGYELTKSPDAPESHPSLLRTFEAELETQFVPHKLWLLAKKMAPLVHLYWHVAKAQAGFECGDHYSGNTHPLMVDFEDLSSQDKDNDYRAMVATLDVIDRLGYEVVRKT